MYLDEAIAELRRREPGHPLVPTFAPILVEDDARVAAEARQWYDTIRTGALPAAVREACLTIFLSWVAERFPQLSAKEFAMILNLPPLTESRAVKELIAEGRRRGERRGERRGHEALLLKQAAHKFGALPAPVAKAIRALDSTELESLGVALPEMPSLKQLRAWLDHHRATRS